MNLCSRGIHAAVARRTSQNVRKQYFQTKQTRKTQNVWCDVVRPSRCNAFAIARFLVLSWITFSSTLIACESEKSYGIYRRLSGFIQRYEGGRIMCSADITGIFTGYELLCRDFVWILRFTEFHWFYSAFDLVTNYHRHCCSLVCIPELRQALFHDIAKTAERPIGSRCLSSQRQSIIIILHSLKLDFRNNYTTFIE